MLGIGFFKTLENFLLGTLCWFILIGSFCFDKNASISGDLYNSNTIISKELPEDYLQNIFSNMERTDQTKYLHKISLRRQVFVEGKILEILQLKKSVFPRDCPDAQLPESRHSA
jgi:hypothetical protein